MPTVPTEHATDAQKLTGAEGLVELLVIELSKSGGTFRIKDNGESLWMGDRYEYYPFSVGGVDYKSSEEESRPQLTLANPEHLFTSSIDQGYLEKATITRYRVLKDNFDNNRDIKESRKWYVRRIVEVASTHIVVELSNLIDGPNYIVPSRMFIPPEFAVVSIG